MKHDRSEGFATTDQQLAYEVRKGSDMNCFDENGRSSDAGVAFIDAWWEHDCVTQEVDLSPSQSIDELQ